MIAIFNNNNDEVLNFLREGASVTKKNAQEKTALRFAAELGREEIVNTIIIDSFDSQRRAGKDWLKISSQIILFPVIQNFLSAEAVALFTVILPGSAINAPEITPTGDAEMLRDAIVENYNTRNPENKIIQEGNNLVGAGSTGFSEFEHLRNLRAWHLSYLQKSEPNNLHLADQKFVQFFNNSEQRQHAFNKDDLITVAAAASNLVEVERILGSMQETGMMRLSEEELFKLTTLRERNKPPQAITSAAATSVSSAKERNGCVVS